MRQATERERLRKEKKRQKVRESERECVNCRKEEACVGAIRRETEKREKERD